ncbi:response regulator [Pseudomonas lopnurensis]|uniref:response regulator n=1 Tax=Pseudomonas lopnurensis TaxID=1477517 RepID=UPI00187A9437|nr:response regulator [Pseudomonas lopnurensis]MBE7373700.1 response regulator [Pseudomonas lopnurensis]
MNEPLTLILIDDHSLLRCGLAELLGAVPDFQVLGMAASGAQGIELAQRLEPAMILLDLHMPGMSGLETLAALKQVQPDSQVVVLTASDSQDDLLAALRGGADGYVLKDTEPEQLVAYLQDCTRGRVTLEPGLMRLLAEEQRVVPPSPGRAAAQDLTERECQTLALIAEGLSNKLIARELGISDGTVKIHVRHLLTKLNLHSRLELAAWAHRGGFLDQQAARSPNRERP